MPRLRSSALQGLAITVLDLSADLLRFLTTAARSRSSLVAENLFLRKQLAFYQEHETKPRRLTDASRITLVFWSRWLDWKQALAIVRPQTLIQWHRRGFQLFWHWKSKPGRPRLPRNIRELIAEMARENLTLGARPRCFGIISKARDLRLSTNGGGGLAVGPGSALPKDIVAILADVHPQSRAIDRGLRFSRGRDGTISSALRAHSHGGGKQENIALQRNCATDRRVDATAVS